MNELFSSRVSYYDVFAILSPGLIITSLFMVSMASFSEKNVLEIVFIGLLAYFIGLLWNKVCEFCFSLFRNDENSIAKEKEKVSQYHANKLSDVSYYEAYYTLQKEGMLGNVPILEGQFAFLRNHFMLVPICIALYSHKILDLERIVAKACCEHTMLLAILLVFCFFGSILYFCCKGSAVQSNHTKSKSGCCSGCLYIVSWVVFMAWLIMYHVKSLGYSFSCNYAVLSIVLTLFFWCTLLYTMSNIQKKIYYLVWEGYLYLSSNKEKK